MRHTLVLSYLVQRGRRFWCGSSLHLKFRWNNDPSLCRTDHRSASMPSRLCHQFSFSQRRLSYSPCGVYKQINIGPSVSLKRNQLPVIDICPAVEVTTSAIPLQKEVKSLLVFPDGLHLLSVVAHVALQPNALWSALQHQLSGRCTCKSVTHIFDYARWHCLGSCMGQPVQLTSDVSDGVDDVIKHCNEKTEALFLLLNVK